jgi:hypothetical protein
MPRRKPDPINFDLTEENNAQNRIARMLKKTGCQSKFLEKLAGKRED